MGQGVVCSRMWSGESRHRSANALTFDAAFLDTSDLDALVKAIIDCAVIPPFLHGIVDPRGNDALRIDVEKRSSGHSCNEGCRQGDGRQDRIPHDACALNGEAREHCDAYQGYMASLSLQSSGATSSEHTLSVPCASAESRPSPRPILVIVQKFRQKAP